ncbi:hypothetical protein L313_2824 [Acinetobacter haemolyticus CIP 64.3 = MTCC 9819]|uniref:Uncharacterized protein n=1 Tax=Acinetobacter haemolyticus CIP 64.3 = MTCC 9819 TaxID=1217659 RepID=N9EZE7_ACIHA|nr:hypothetical protein [Acinetobacter haemolyticus]ENW15642.1 hypothetical protein F927_03382 [Acinetobacter haemolyticus CIP 64.3 = MTCC 9819]EPR90414.1 hypothetical protein L313_2824 [Acinetobacter haemolyticus CIP 64.3 = MTCC 9819]QXZ26446.1 hypothetical protein I6L22_14950 [Acinetobacter haemolyticus]SPT48065.1 Uncharacterised protein [Acinetobacter haemolyticus]SPT48635.1 Uncharacterised protein [Acinetobacter haemolyticus]
MFLVKSCSKKFNVSNSKTIKIGTLHEYRETESLQILDKKEGFFNIIVNLKDKYIDINLFNHINKSHDSDFYTYVKNLSIKDMTPESVKVDYLVFFNWINNNRFIFCISKLEKHEDSVSIFSDYDDYWYLSIFKKSIFIKKIELSLFNEIKKLLNNGEKIFTKENIDINNLSIKSYAQDIIYTKRTLYLDNNNIDLEKNNLIGLFDNIKHIKPETFSRENEYRIVFDFYEKDTLLTPVVKSVIIPESVSEIIKQPNLCR